MWDPFIGEQYMHTTPVPDEITARIEFRNDRWHLITITKEGNMEKIECPATLTNTALKDAFPTRRNKFDSDNYE